MPQWRGNTSCSTVGGSCADNCWQPPTTALHWLHFWLQCHHGRTAASFATPLAPIRGNNTQSSKTATTTFLVSCHNPTAPQTHLEELPVLVPEEGWCVALQHCCQLRHAACGLAKASWRTYTRSALQLVTEVGGHQLSGKRTLNQVTEGLQQR